MFFVFFCWFLRFYFKSSPKLRILFAIGSGRRRSGESCLRNSGCNCCCRCGSRRHRRRVRRGCLPGQCELWSEVGQIESGERQLAGGDARREVIAECRLSLLCGGSSLAWRRRKAGQDGALRHLQPLRHRWDSGQRGWKSRYVRFHVRQQLLQLVQHFM